MTTEQLDRADALVAELDEIALAHTRSPIDGGWDRDRVAVELHRRSTFLKHVNGLRYDLHFARNPDPDYDRSFEPEGMKAR